MIDDTSGFRLSRRAGQPKSQRGKMTNAGFYDLVINGSAGLQRLALQRRRSFPLILHIVDSEKNGPPHAISEIPEAVGSVRVHVVQRSVRDTGPRADA